MMYILLKAFGSYLIQFWLVSILEVYWIKLFHEF